MKNCLLMLKIFAVAGLFMLGASVCPAQMVVGNYRPTEKNTQDVKSAADFAVNAENAKRAAADAFKLRSIEKADRQIVAGTNYRLCLEVESGGEKQQATAVVYLNLQNEYSLTNWTGGNCASGEKSTPRSEETENSLDTFKGKLEIGKTNSTILYVGEESGDYAAFCFLNDSEAGRRILAACKNGEQCEFTGKVNYESPCKVPGLEAALSASGKIISVSAIKSFAKTSAVKKNGAAALIAPDAIVRNLYAAQKVNKSPFFQTKSRALVDKYFIREIADLIWKDAVTANGEVGALEADPLYNAQDRQITLFKIGKPEYGEGNLDLADVPVTFKNFGKAETILFRFERNDRKTWKISDIFYPSNEAAASSLKSMLSQ